jgi:SAM-dependent methyltransferase
MNEEASLTFRLGGEVYPYYRYCRATERVVEIPFVLSEMFDMPRALNVLEVGNVANRYTDLANLGTYVLHYRLVDKYAEFTHGVPGYVEQTDIVSLDLPPSYFDRVICISTIEHVGFDYGEVGGQEKVASVLKKLVGVLRPGGQLSLTYPVNYRPELNDLIYEFFTVTNADTRWMRMCNSVTNDWEEVSYMEAEATPYDRNKNRAQAVMLSKWIRV